MADQVRINKNLYSWASIILKVAEERFTGFTAIGYGDKLERSVAYGMGGLPRGISRGKYTVDESTLTGHTDTVQEVRKALANLSQDKKSYGDVRFQIVIQYVEQDLEPQTVELEDCVWIASNSSPSEGAEALTEDITFQPMRIRRNGLTLFEERNG